MLCAKSSERFIIANIVVRLCVAFVREFVGAMDVKCDGTYIKYRFDAMDDAAKLNVNSIINANNKDLLSYMHLCEIFVSLINTETHLRTHRFRPLATSSFLW